MTAMLLLDAKEHFILSIQAISKEIGGKHNDWWASYKPFKCRNWNADEFERLYDGTIKDEIKRIVTKLCDDLKGIEDFR